MGFRQLRLEQRVTQILRHLDTNLPFPLHKTASPRYRLLRSSKRSRGSSVLARKA